MEFTYAKTKKDLKEIADMMGRIFRRKNWFEFYEQRMSYQTKSPYFKPEHSRIARMDGKLVGHVSIIEKYMRVGICVVKVAGIGDVYTHPDARGKHVSTHLMNDCIDYMRHNEYPISMLYGIPNFYHKFGYIEAMGEHKQFLPLKNFVKVESDLNLRPCKKGDVPVLNTIYNENFEGKTGFMERVEKSWYNIAEPKSLFVVPDAKDKPAGYVIYVKVWGGGGYVSEVAAPTEEIKRAILAFIKEKTQEAFLSETEFRIAQKDPFAEFLKDFAPRVQVKYFAEGEGNAMLRIVDLPLLLKKIKPELESRLASSEFSRKKGGLNIKTDDAGKACIAFQNGKITITKGLKKDLPTLETKQNLLTRSVMGYWTPNRLMERTKAEGFEPPKEIKPFIKALFPEGSPFTSEPDYF